MSGFLSIFGDTREQAISNLYWSVWIGVMFLVPELLAWAHAIPMYTLSHTSWIDEKAYPLLKPALWGFLVGLSTHICYGTRLGRAELGGMTIAVVVHSLWGLL